MELNRLFFAVLFMLFVLIRVRWHSAWADTERRQIYNRRETITASIFSLCLLFAHVGWLSGAFPETVELTQNIETMVQGIGLVLMAIGVRLLHRVHAVLGENFSPKLELRESHTLVMSGPYSLVRHPMYTSGFSFLIGAGLLSTNIWVLLPPLLSFTMLVVLRLKDEEHMLAERFGEQWKAYQKRTGMLLPRMR